MIEVGILLLNYKCSHYIEQLYSNIYEKIGLDSDRWLFLIVDNSVDENESIFIEKFRFGKKNVKCIYSNENKGYAHGNNIGLKYLFDNKIEYGLIINPDIVVLTNNFFLNYIELIKSNKEICVIGPKLLSSRRIEIPTIPRMNLINSFIGLKNEYSGDLSKPVYATAGCCLFVDVNKLNEIDFFDENTFLYREEQILAEKLLANNMLWYSLPNVETIHNHSRKVQTPLGFLRHKFYEFESTKYYLIQYLKSDTLFIWCYSSMFILKTILYLTFVLILSLKCKQKKIFG